MCPLYPEIQFMCPLQKEDLTILDLGTGNAVLLVALAQHGYRNLTGSDYSTASIQLSQAVLAKHGLSGQVSLVVRHIPHPRDSTTNESYDLACALHLHEES